MIIAQERSLRPTDAGASTDKKLICPFCTGNESGTPGEIRVQRTEESAANGPGWTIRVVPNRYAALRIEGELGHSTDGMFNFMNGVGAHEVIIETPEHEARMSEYSVAKLASVLGVYKERLTDLHRDSRFHYVQVFRNYGRHAGASLRHPHSQIIALPMIPRWLISELSNAQTYHLDKGRCVFCDLIKQDMWHRGRIVAENEAFIAITPYAPRLPFEVWILPLDHAHDFSATSDEDLTLLASLMKRTLWALQEALDDPPFNFIIHSAPDLLHEHEGHAEVGKSYHWHIEIVPRVSNLAGFELGTGFHINPVSPEHAAEQMRAVLKERPEAPDLVDDQMSEPASAGA